MYFPGDIKKDGNFWLVEIPDLAVATQGRTQREARKMIADAIQCLVNKKGFKVAISKTGKDSFLVSANDPKLLMALFLKRQREAQRLSIREVAQALKFSSHASYSQYELGKSMPGIDLVERFVSVINPKAALCVTLATAC